MIKNKQDLKDFRCFLKKHKMSQAQFAKMAESSFSTINDYYTGKTRVPGWVHAMMRCYEQGFASKSC